MKTFLRFSLCHLLEDHKALKNPKKKVLLGPLARYFQREGKMGCLDLWEDLKAQREGLE